MSCQTIISDSAKRMLYLLPVFEKNIMQECVMIQTTSEEVRCAFSA